MKRLIARYGHIAGAFALLMTTVMTVGACTWIFHQPVIPESVKKRKELK